MVKSDTDQEAQRKAREFQAEQRRKKIINLSVLFGSVFAAVAVLIYFQGRKVATMIFHAETGVYADCSKAENRNIAYCQPKRSASQEEWSEVTRSKGGKAVPFSLYKIGK